MLSTELQVRSRRVGDLYAWVRKRSWFVGIAAGLMIVPYAFWHSGLYRVGGDDSLLYYMFPREMLGQFTSSLIGDNAPSGVGTYGQQLYTAPFFTLLSLLNEVLPLNLQLVSYGLVLSVGFLGFSYLLGSIIREDDPHGELSRIVGGLVYSLSTFAAYTVWTSQLLSVYLVPVFPICLGLFIKAVDKRDLRRIVLCALVASVFSSAILAGGPWLLAMALVFLPVVSLRISRRHARRALAYAGAFILIFVFLNAYWLLYASHGALSKSETTRSGFSFSQQEETLIRTVAEDNSLTYPMLNLFHKGIQERFAWSALPIYRNWHLRLLLANVIFIIVIMLAGGLVAKMPGLRRPYAASVLTYLLALYFFTVSIGDWGMRTFLWLGKHVPGFLMFRNMYDKFGLALALSFALLVGISTLVIARHLLNKWSKQLLVAGIIAMTLLNAKPFLLGEYYNEPMWTTKATMNTVRGFASEFDSLVAYLGEREWNGRFLWWPMNLANYVQIPDKQLESHYYSGVSPLGFLAHVTDLSGRLSFGEDGETLVQAVMDGRRQEVGETLRRFNINYVIVNHVISSDLQGSYLFSLYGRGDFYQRQTQLRPFILGRKVRDFGDAFSLYEINPQLQSAPIYVAESLNSTHGVSRVGYRKTGRYSYSVSIPRDAQYLVLTEPFDEGWSLDVRGREHVPVEHLRAGWSANAWKIVPSGEPGRGADYLEAVIRFSPYSDLRFGWWISLAALLGCLGYIMKGRLHRGVDGKAVQVVASVHSSHEDVTFSN